jgi:predicted enzyme related to lactoylglutathione lyase
MLRHSAAFSGYSVDDAEAAVRFYRDVLGLEVRRDEQMPGMLTVEAGGRGVLLYAKDDHVPATFTVLNFPVADIEGTVRGLASRGADFERYEGFDQDALGIHRGGGPLIAWFTDPAGNVLSVIET